MKMPDLIPARSGGNYLPVRIIRQFRFKDRKQVGIGRHTAVNTHHERHMRVPLKHAGGFVHAHTADNTGIEAFEFRYDIFGGHDIQEFFYLFHPIVEKRRRPGPLTVFANFEVIQRTGIAGGHFGCKSF